MQNQSSHDPISPLALAANSYLTTLYSANSFYWLWSLQCRKYVVLSFVSIILIKCRQTEFLLVKIHSCRLCNKNRQVTAANTCSTITCPSLCTFIMILRELSLRPMKLDLLFLAITRMLCLHPHHSLHPQGHRQMENTTRNDLKNLQF